MPQKKSPSSEPVLTADQPVAYQLSFREGEAVARLTSPNLDRTMHARNGVNVRFESFRSPGKGRPLKLDAFEAASLVEYLQSQDAVRKELERELDDLLETWDEEEEVGRGPDVWGQTKIEGVQLSPRELATPQQVRAIEKQYGKSDAKKILRENFDAPGARSSFVVTMQPKWAGDHLLMVQFRDGKAMELQLEG